MTARMSPPDRRPFALALLFALGVSAASTASESRPRRPPTPRPTAAVLPAARPPMAPKTSIRPVGDDGKPMPRVGLHAQAAALCTPTPLPKGGPPPFAPGEKLQFELDSLGAVIGTLSLAILPGRGDEPWVIEARGKTGTFAANFYAVDALAQATLGRKLETKKYFEDADESGTRRTVDVAFGPTEGHLKIRATEGGLPRDYAVESPDEVRDILSALYLVRGLRLDDGDEVCLPVFASRRVWVIQGKVAGRETVRTAAGDYRTVHLEATATRADSPSVSREVHFWLSDDAARTPVAAFGLIQNKPLRAQLVKHDPGRAPVAQAPRR